MNCERATLIAMLREAEGNLRDARERKSTPKKVRYAHEVKDLETEVTAWDRAYDARLRKEKAS